LSAQEWKTPVLQIAIQVALGDPRLQGDNAQFLVHGLDPVHPRKINEDAAVPHGSGVAVSPIPSGTYRVERDPMRSSHTNDVDDLFLVAGKEGSEDPN
jgi:hypothetical protein